MADPQSSVRVIVQWNGAPDDSKEQKVLNRGGIIHSRFRSIPAGAYTLPVSMIKDLANDPAVAYITPDRPLSAKLDNTAAAVNASAVWSAGWTGTGIGVAVIDSGMNPDPNLGPGKKIVYTYDFTAKNALGPIGGVLPAIGSIVPALLEKGPAPLPSNGPAQDQYGHGQHIAGIHCFERPEL